MRISDWSSDVCSSDLAIMIVERMHRLQMQQAGTAVRVLHRKARDHLAHPIAVRDRPAIAAKLHRHPLGPERYQFGRVAIGIMDHLPIADRKSKRLNSSH